MRTVPELDDDALRAPLGPAKPQEKEWTDLDERAARRRIAERTATPGIVVGEDGKMRTDLPDPPFIY